MARSCELDSNHGPLDYCEGCDTCHACNEARIAELTAESQRQQKELIVIKMLILESRYSYGRMPEALVNAALQGEGKE